MTDLHRKEFFKLIHMCIYDTKDLFEEFNSKCDCIKNQVISVLNISPDYKDINLNIVKYTHIFDSYNFVIKYLLSKDSFKISDLIEFITNFDDGVEFEIYTCLYEEIEKWINKNRVSLSKDKKQLVEDNSSDKENFFNILKELYFNKEPDLFGFFTSRCDCTKEEVLYDLKDETKYSNIDFDLVKKNYKFSSYSSVLKDLVDKHLITFFNLINEVYEYHGNLNVNLYNYIWFDIETWIKKNKKLVLKKKND